jgi:hypothetical protein
MSARVHPALVSKESNLSATAIPASSVQACVDTEAGLEKTLSVQEQVSITEARLRRLEGERARIFNRANSRWMEPWDCYIMILLIYTAIVTPYHLAYLQPSVDAFYWIDRVIDLSFLADMAICANTAIWDADVGKWCYNREKILKEYFKFWLWIDVIAVVPFDMFSLHLMPDENSVSLSALTFDVPRIVHALFR